MSSCAWSTPPVLRRNCAAWGAASRDLERYVRHALGARWPRLVLTVALDPGELLRVRQQLWLCAIVPPEGMRSPVLWLDEPGAWEEPAVTVVSRTLPVLQEF
jgi:hypothetical protein